MIGVAKGLVVIQIFCDGCQSWKHKKCSSFKGRFKAIPKNIFKRYTRLCKPVDDRPEKHLTLEGIQLDTVEPFCYLGDKICPGGGCELATIARTRAAWGKFCELLPLLTFTTISLARCEKLHDSCVRGALLNTSKCSPLQSEVQRLLHNKRAMFRWVLKIKAEYNVSLSTMYGWLNLVPLESKLRLNHLRWFGHVEASD